MFNKNISICVIATASVFTTALFADRDQMKIVGSSEVFPFSTTVGGLCQITKRHIWSQEYGICYPQ
jgi:hypothetical protein